MACDLASTYKTLTVTEVIITDALHVYGNRSDADTVDR